MVGLAWGKLRFARLLFGNPTFKESESRESSTELAKFIKRDTHLKNSTKKNRELKNSIERNRNKISYPKIEKNNFLLRSPGIEPGAHRNCKHFSCFWQRWILPLYKGLVIGQGIWN
jgi:hypothetical protein